MSITHWLITKKDGSTVRIKAEYSGYVKQQLLLGSGTLHRKNSPPINIEDIASFEPMDAEEITETASQIFGMPVYTTVDGEQMIKCKAVKKGVPFGKWEKHYSHIPHYHLIGTEGTYALIGFWLPIHLIDESEVSLCNEAEIAKLR